MVLGVFAKEDLLLDGSDWNVYSVPWRAQLDELLYLGSYLNFEFNGQFFTKGIIICI